MEPMTVIELRGLNTRVQIKIQTFILTKIIRDGIQLK